jgi:hypothetical protein
MAGALGLVITTDVSIAGGHAIPVYVDDTLPIVGPSRACVVTTGEVPQAGGPPLAVRLAPAGTPAIGPALPVYVIPGGGSLGGSAASSSLIDAVIYWALEAASGARIDATARGNTLSPNNAPGNAAGKIGNALSVVAASNQSLSMVDNADISIGASAFEMTFWMWSNTIASCSVLGKDDEAGNREWFIDMSSTNIRFLAWCAGSLKLAANIISMTPSTWYFVDVYFDPVAQLLGIAVNGGAFTTAATAAGSIDNLAAPFYLGARNNTHFFDGRIDELGVWKRNLTTAERAALYNGGNGITYPF